MSQINRTGKVVFNDASLSVWEDGLGGTHQERNSWEKSFKQQVFKRIIQTLNRLGWVCVIPKDKIEQYGLSFARGYRYCVKGDLKADLGICGRHIEFKMFQSINTPDRPDHDGRYQRDLEKHMPYLLRLEMERTRRKIRDYFCNIFSGYEFKADRNDGRMNKRGPGHLTAMEWLNGCYETSWHFKGDLDAYEISDYNRKSANGNMLNHGDRVWFTDWKGRICTGIANYNINNMWWVITGKYDVSNISSGRLFTSPPADVRTKRNDSLRRKRLESELSKAVKVMNFNRAELFKNLLFPEKTQLYLVQNNEGLYHRAGFCGYTSDSVDAGKFTTDEIGRYRDGNKVIAVGA